MDAIHVVLSSESLSAKVFSVTDVFLGLIIAIGIISLAMHSKPLMQRFFYRGQSDDGLRQRRKIRPRQSIAHIADALSDVIDRMVHSQYVVKDKKRYASVYQTPLRDNLKVLRALSQELRQSTYFTSNTSTLSNNKYLRAQHQHVPSANALIPKAQITMPLVTTTVSSEQVTHDILPAIKDYAEREHMNLSFVEEAHGYLKAPSGATEKLLRELLLNAIKHNSKDTKITFTCSFTTQCAVFEIQDNGSGILSSVVNHALAPEMQKEELRVRRLSDAETQVNLMVVAAMAKSLGGELDIRSAKNWGTHIRLILPATQIVARPSYKKYIKTTTAPVIAADNRKKILFISKQTMVKDTLYENFNERYALYVYSSFDKALMALFDITPDIVIADFSWQHALGTQFCQYLRGSSVTSRVPFVMLTMAIDQATRVNMYASGVSAIVEKPLDVQEIKVVLENLIRNLSVSEDEVKEARANYSIDSMVLECESDQSEFVSSLHKIVKENFQAEQFNRFEAATLLNISEKTLQRRMNRYFAMPFGQYLRKYRLEQARERLLAGQFITDVTFDVGFNSTSYFGQCFKQEFGYPPSMLSKAIG